MESLLLLVGAFAAVPWTLRLVERGTVLGAGRFGFARRCCFPAAAALAASQAFAPGALAAALAVPWLLLTLLVALLGMLRAAERGGGPAAELTIDFGLCYLAVGGAWTFASRAGIEPLGFSEPWVLLTAVHFHFAGLVLPVVTGRLARHLPGPLGTTNAITVALGVPLVAIGITAAKAGHPDVDLALALVLVAGAALTVVQLGRVAVRTEQRAERILAATAGLALALGMTLVVVYAMTKWNGAPALSLAAMVATHAPLQVFGFALPALLLVQCLPKPTEVPHFEILLPWLGDAPQVGLWEARAFGPAVTPGARGVATDEHLAELGNEPPGAPLADGPFRRAADLVCSYRAFPQELIEGLRAPVAVALGETVRARYRLLPFVHLVFAARVVEVFDELRDGVQRTGFTYRTLAGHPECGVETFLVEKNLANGRVHAALRAHSRPGCLLVRVLRPLCRRLQLAGGRAAAKRLRALGNAPR